MHRLLKRQIKKYLSKIDELPEEMKELLQVISQAYEEADIDRLMLERSLDLTSEELLEKNRWLEEKNVLADHQYSEILANSGDLIQTVWPNGKISNVNQTWLETMGYDLNETASLCLSDVICADEIKHCETTFNSLTNKQSVKKVSTTFQSKEGGDVFVEGHIIGNYEGNELRHVRCYFTNISERVTQSKIILENEKRYRQLVEEASDVIYIISPEGHFVYVNASGNNLTGYLSEELIGMHFLKLIHSDWKKETLKFYIGQMKNEVEESVFQFLMRTKHEKDIWVEQTARLLKENGKITGLEVIARDISKRKEVELSLQDKLYFEALLASIAVNLVRTTSQDISISVSNALATIGSEFSAARGAILLADSTKSNSFSAQFKWQKQGLETPHIFNDTILLQGDEIAAIVEQEYWLFPTESPTEKLNVVFRLLGKSSVVIPLVLDNKFEGLFVLSRMHSNEPWTEEEVLYLRVLAQNIANAIRHKHNRELLQQRNELLTGLVELAKASIQQNDRKETLVSILDILVKITGASYGDFFLLNNEMDVSEYVLSNEGGTEKQRKQFIDDVMTSGTVGWVKTHKEIAIIPDVFQDNRWAQNPYQKQTIQSSITVPIFYHDNLLGIITLMHIDRAFFNEDHLALIEKASDQIALALANAQAYYIQQTLAEHQSILYEALRELSIQRDPQALADQAIEFLVNLTEWQWVSILVVDQKNIEEYIFSTSLPETVTPPVEEVLAGKGIAGRILKTMEYEYIQNVNEDPDYLPLPIKIGSELGIPFYHGRHIKGLVLIQSPNIAGISNEESLLAQSIADVLGLALGNATLFKEMQEHSNHLVEADKLKSRFLANMSHEMRTPLNAIIGLSSLLEDSEKDTQQKDFLSTIQNSSKLLLSTINDILDFSKIEAGKLNFNRTLFNLRTLIAEVVNICKIYADEKSLDLGISIDQEIPDYFVGDPNRIQQILLNLVNNALKFTTKGKVTIVVKPFDGIPNLLFEIHDTGMGIPGNKIEELFVPFKQVDSTSAREFEGTGLGLVICEQLVSRMGGDIWVESMPGKGSIFYFTLDIATAEEGVQMESDDTNSAQVQRLNQLKILLAEDNKVNQMVALHTFKNIGLSADIDVAENGREVLAHLEGNFYDLILMDVQMPLLDGIETTKIIRAKLGIVQPKIIALTAHAMSDDRKLCLAAGMDGYIEKPFETKELINTISDVMNKG